MSNVLTLLKSKHYEFTENLKKRPIVVESICYSYYYTHICKYFRFTNNGDTLLCYGIFDSNIVYIIGWNYEYLKKLSPKYIIGKIELRHSEDNSQFSFSLYQEVHNEYWVTLLQENHHEVPFSFSIFIPQTNDLITCRTNIQPPSLHCIQNPTLCLFTLQGCCLILPSRSSFHCIQFRHSKPRSLTPIQLNQFYKTQAKRKLQHPTTEQTKLRFLQHKQKEWIETAELEDVFVSHNQIQMESIQSEVHQLGQIQTDYKLMNVCVSLDTIVSLLFAKCAILHFSYCVMNSYLCDECCPLPHFVITFSVLSSNTHHSRSTYTVRHHLVSVEISLHDETFYTKQMNINECASFVVLQNCLQQEWLQPGSIHLTEMKQRADHTLRGYEKRVKRNLCVIERGRGFYYPSEMKFKYVVNSADGDTILTL